MTKRSQMTSTKRRTLIKGAGAALVLPHIWVPKAGAASKRVIIRSPGGVYDEIRRRAIYEPFTKETGIEVIPVATTAAKLLAMLRSGHIELDVIDITVPQLIHFERANALLPIPYDDFKYADPDNIYPEYKRENMVGNFIYGVIMGYNTEAFKGNPAPANWAEFWDIERYPQHRMMSDMAAGAPDLEFALLADGVPLDELYPLDIERAFASLDRVRPAVRKFWDTGALSAQMLIDREVDMGSIWSSRLLTVQDAGAPVEANWNEHCVHVQSYAIMKDGPNVENATLLVDYMLGEEAQDRYFKEYKAGPITKKAYENLSEEHRAVIPGGEKTEEMGFILDAEWWVDNRQKVSDMWSQWIMQG